MCWVLATHLAESHQVTVLTSVADMSATTTTMENPRVLRVLRLREQSPTARARALLDAVRSTRQTRRILATVDPEVVFVFNGRGISQVGLLTLAEADLPMIVRVGDYWLERLYLDDPYLRFLRPGGRLARRVWSTFIRLLNRHPALSHDPSRARPTSLAWTSAALADLCEITQAIEPTIERIVPAASPHEERLRRSVRRPSQTPTVAYVGRLEADKGPQVAYKAIAALRDRHGVTAKLRLAGRVDPRIEVQLHDLSERLEIVPQIELLGVVGPDGLEQLLSSAHALVIPSLWQEPFGIVCVEGALARVPVIASQTGGLIEVLHQESEALFFPVGRWSLCADALAETLAGGAAVQERVERAHRRALELSLSNFTDSMTSLMMDTLAVGGVTPAAHSRQSTTAEAAAPAKPDGHVAGQPGGVRRPATRRI